MTFILGGARSGKTSYALQLAKQRSTSVCYLATATPFDEEMEIRIANHRAERPIHWNTLEIPTHIGKALLENPPVDSLILVDCLTLLANNVLLTLPENVSEPVYDQAMQVEMEELLKAYTQLPIHMIVVSNEVGLGLVPPYPLGRLYRDVLGRANQMVAKAADEVLFMVAGIPMKVK